MNATKRKFNALLQGLNSPRPSTSDSKNKPSRVESLSQKRRRLGLSSGSEGTMESSASLGSLTSLSPLRKPSSGPEASKTKEIAARYCPGDREQLLRRLATFQELTDWTPKPDRVSEAEWAKRGWVCQGKERVRCVLCHKELVVKLNRKQQDGKEVAVLVASEIEDALVDKYVDLIVSSHTQDCLWKKRGCDGSLLRISFSSAAATLEALRTRYDELCSRQAFLPYEFNLRLPDEMSLNAILHQLPSNFFTEPPPPPSSGSGPSPNRPALALALLGWQGLSNARIGPVPNTASCHTCLRRLGLWMFKSKEVDEDGQVIVPAPMDHLDPLREHRFFCPWKNASAQTRQGSTEQDNNATAAWGALLQMLKNESELRNMYEGRAKKNTKDADSVAPSTPPREPSMAEPPSAHSAMSYAEADGDAERAAKDKERWARLRKVKSLFDTKNGKKFRPGSFMTHSPRSTAQ